MFGRGSIKPGKVTVSTPPSAPGDDLGGEDLTVGLDVIAAMLRLVSTHTLPIEGLEPAQIADQCEAWARHVLLLAPPPGTSTPTKRRNWNGLRRFFTEIREGEATTVNRSIAGLRDTIWDFIQRLNNVIVGDNEVDGRVRGQLDTLKKAAESNSPDELRRAALGVVTAVTVLLEERKRAQATHLQELAGRVKQLTAELDEARRQGAQDPLTKLFNRGAFDDYVKRVVALDGLFGKAACLLMVDVDNFKRVNDDYGHPTGDEVLRKLGDALVRCFPRNGDFVARYGGEEFAIVLRDTRMGDARMLAGRLLTSIRKMQIKRGETSFGFTVSAGLAELRQGESGTSWIERADRALYEAKRAGRDRTVEAQN
jgi:diguanylate cyclase (GGDEF)-like protein